MNYYYKRAFKKSFDVEGRDNRPQYWYFYLYNLIVIIFIYIIDLIIYANFSVSLLIDTYLINLYYLIILIPAFSVAIRRLHDIGKSSLWLLIGLIPVIGQIWLIILFATKGEDKPNKYGPVPGKEKPQVKNQK